MNPTVIYPKPGRLLKLLAIGACFVGLGVAFAAFRDEMGLPAWAVWITSYAGVPLFGFATLYGCYRLVAPSPALVIDEHGVTDHASAVGVGLIRWEEMDAIGVQELMGARMLGIVLKDERAVLDRQHPVKRVLLKFNRGLGPALVMIPESMLPHSELVRKSAA